MRVPYLAHIMWAHGEWKQLHVCATFLHDMGPPSVWEILCIFASYCNFFVDTILKGITVNINKL